MPKRSEAYMSGQRDLVARAAYEVMLEKGLHDASLRDICTRAGVSIGAFYNLFPTKADAIVASRLLNLAVQPKLPAVQCWDDYVAYLVGQYCSRDPKSLQRQRLALQFAAEVLQLKSNPAGLSEIYDAQRKQLTVYLAGLHANGEISLPFGLEQTVEIHALLALGASYRLANDLDLGVEDAAALLAAGLAGTAGLIAGRAQQ